jgi:O-methyltransferase domain/Dimerisation domain
MPPDQQAERRQLLAMINGFQVSAAIHVAASLGIADLLSDGPKRLDELATATHTSAAELERLLLALASLGIFAESEAGFIQTALSHHLREDGSLKAWAMQVGRDYFWTSWGQLEYSVRSGRPAFPHIYGTSAWEYRAAHPEDNAVFNAAMTQLMAGRVEAIVAGYDFSGIGQLVDVGGGQGELVAAVLAANPSMRGIVFDQPHVVASARALLAARGVADRCGIAEGDFFDSVPPGADAYILASILHDWEDQACLTILRSCRTAIRERGRLLIVEQVLGSANQPDPARFSDLNMLVMLGGRERTAAEFQALFDEAKFRLSQIVPTASPYSVIEARPV